MTEQKDLSGQREPDLRGVLAEREACALCADDFDGVTGLESSGRELDDRYVRGSMNASRLIAAAIRARSTPPAAIAQPGDGRPVSPADGEVEIARIAIDRLQAFARMSGNPSDEEFGADCATAILSSPYITRLREQRDDTLRHAFRNADALDWNHLFKMLPDSGHGQFWKAVLAEARRALSNADTSGLSSRRDEMVTPSAEAASAIAYGDKGGE